MMTELMTCMIAQEEEAAVAVMVGMKIDPMDAQTALHTEGAGQALIIVELGVLYMTAMTLPHMAGAGVPSMVVVGGEDSKTFWNQVHMHHMPHPVCDFFFCSSFASIMFYC